MCAEKAKKKCGRIKFFAGVHLKCRQSSKSSTADWFDKSEATLKRESDVGGGGLVVSSRGRAFNLIPRYLGGQAGKGCVCGCNLCPSTF